MLRNLKFKQKIFLLPALAMLSYVALLAVTQVLDARTSKLLGEIQTGYAPALEMSRNLDVTLTQMQRTLQDAVAAEDEEGLKRADGLRDAFFAQLESGRTNPVIAAGRIDALHQRFQDYEELARPVSRQLLHRTLHGGDATDTLSQMTQRYNAVREALSQATQNDKRDMEAAIASAQARQHLSMLVSAALIAVFLVLSGVLAMLLANGVARPLAALAAAAARIANEGDLSHRFEIDSSDEVGDLARSFQAMVQRLREIPTTISGSVGELTGAVTSLTALTKNQTLNLQRQASGLAEASATTQEIKQTSTVAATKAEAVLRVAVKAEELSSSGQQAVEASIQGLKNIREQVETTTMKISELSRRMQLVGEITERVKDLADQSNMLALNAAIEATKAGEFGKGFAVVAREIRSLADQSLQSAARIREILGEINQAILATVDSTQAGNRRIEEGLNQIRASGESLRGITNIVEETSQSARQIVASVNQQNAGISQISTAIISLNEAMQEALEGVRLAETSASNVQGTSTALANIVSGFKV